jgi:Tfp pilus assembly protein PilN
MIRINLLPREEKAQRKPVFQFKAGEMVVPVAVLAAAGLILAGTAFSQRARISSLTHSIADIDAQSRALAPQIARVNQLAQERAEPTCAWASSTSRRPTRPST